MSVRPRPRLAIRVMRGDDLEPVMAIERTAFRHPWSPELLKRELEHDWSTILVAIEPGPPHGKETIVGFLIYWMVHDEMHVLNVAVDPPLRRRGVGRALMLEAMHRSKQAGAALATLEVRRSNEGALALYRQLGFRPVGVRPNYYIDEGEDAIVMVLDL